MGSYVYLKKCAFTRRHKLENVYLDEIYVVIWVNPTKDVYQIRPINGGPARVVNRRLIREVPSNLDVVEADVDDVVVDDVEDVEFNSEERGDYPLSFRNVSQEFRDEYVLLPERVNTEIVGETVNRTGEGEGPRSETK